MPSRNAIFSPVVWAHLVSLPGIVADSDEQQDLSCHRHTIHRQEPLPGVSCCPCCQVNKGTDVKG